MKDDLNQLIESMRLQMVLLVTEKGSFVDDRVVELSQELDQLLDQFHRLNGTDPISALRTRRNTA